MTTIRVEARAFVDIGPLPAEETAEQDDIEARERRLPQITSRSATLASGGWLCVIL